MNRIQLQKVAAMLKGLETGTWLDAQLEAGDASSTIPRVLVLVSAQQEVERAFPSGLKLEPQWVEWTGEGSPDVADVEQVDLLLWGMAALAMFPGEYAAVLEQARRERIPIWAVVVGLGRLPEKAEFLRRRLPVYQASLPEHSEIFIHQGAKGENISERIVQMLHERAVLLSQSGTDRRLTRLAERVSARLVTERKILQAGVQRAEQFATTGQRGLESLQILVGTAASKILEAYYPLHEQFHRLQQKLSDDIAVGHKEVKVDELVLLLQQSLSRWRAVTFEPEIDRLTRLAQQHLVKWCESYSEDLSGFFRASQLLMQGYDAQKSQPTLESEEILEKVAPLFAATQHDLLKIFDRFAHWMTGSGGAENITIKQKVLKNLEVRIRQTDEELDAVLTKQIPRLGALLKEALEQQGEMHLEFITPTVAIPQEKLVRITEAEKTLLRCFS